jgi:hypothetical protein
MRFANQGSGGAIDWEALISTEIEIRCYTALSSILIFTFIFTLFNPAHESQIK